MDYFFDKVMPGMLVGLLGCVVVAFLAMLFDGMQEYRAFPAIAECRQQGKEGLRRYLEAEVVCVERLPYSVDLR